MDKRQLTLGTISFMLCFAAWGLISAFAPRFREILHLTASQTALLIAVPVLLGALARLPMGLLTDRYKGRAVFTALMLFAALPPLFAPAASSYPMLLSVAFLMGMAGSSFAVGVGFVSRWFKPEQQGSALGVYGLGNIGQSAAVFLGPVLAGLIGMENVFRGLSALLITWAAIFYFAARNPPVEVKPKPLSAMLSLLARERLAWVLSAFYFLTFGGFVAFSIYLPSLLKDQFGLKPADAGLRTAGFVILATLLRPVGGWLADRIGGARVLSLIFIGVVPFALLLAWNSIIPFTVGALGCAALLGLGNGAVFKLVPQYFPTETGTVTGLVGAMGGMGGFFPPLLLGFFRDTMGVVWPGFVLLAITAFVLWRVNARVFLNQPAATDTTESAVPQHVRAAAWATLFAGLLIASIVVGSRNLKSFDPALVIYTFAIVFASWGVVYHYNVWIGKPPTRVYWDRGWQIVREKGLLWSVPRLVALTGTNILAQTFIRKRSVLRWWMHQCLFWGCMLAMAITFPLVFGWISFGSRPDYQMTYITYLFGFPAGEFPLGTPIAALLFHGLDIAAVLVLTGIGLSLWRRMREAGALSVQSFAADFLPLFMLFAISVTGLALTVSQMWMRGQAYSFISILHAITVISGLLYMPFGKFFHVFQRPAQLGVKLYHEVGAETEGAKCVRCGVIFASRMHLNDLNGKVLPQMGFDYKMKSGGYWQDQCPACKRKSLTSARMKLAVKSNG